MFSQPPSAAAPLNPAVHTVSIETRHARLTLFAPQRCPQTGQARFAPGDVLRGTVELLSSKPSTSKLKLTATFSGRFYNNLPEKKQDVFTAWDSVQHTHAAVFPVCQPVTLQDIVPGESFELAIPPGDDAGRPLPPSVSSERHHDQGARTRRNVYVEYELAVKWVRSKFLGDKYPSISAPIQLIPRSFAPPTRSLEDTSAWSAMPMHDLPGSGIFIPKTRIFPLSSHVPLILDFGPDSIPPQSVKLGLYRTLAFTDPRQPFVKKLSSTDALRLEHVEGRWHGVVDLSPAGELPSAESAFVVISYAIRVHLEFASGVEPLIYNLSIKCATDAPPDPPSPSSWRRSLATAHSMSSWAETHSVASGGTRASGSRGSSGSGRSQGMFRWGVESAQGWPEDADEDARYAPSAPGTSASAAGWGPELGGAGGGWR